MELDGPILTSAAPPMDIGQRISADISTQASGLATLLSMDISSQTSILTSEISTDISMGNEFLSSAISVNLSNRVIM